MVLVGVEDQGDAVAIDVDQNWTGYELDDQEELKRTIECPFCGKYPFGKEIHAYNIVRVVMFLDDDDDAKESDLREMLQAPDWPHPGKEDENESD